VVTLGHGLELLPKLDEHRDRRRIRRPLTDEELARLLAVAEERGRRAWYLTAALAGLRRSELIRLTWASVDLEGGVLTIRDGKAADRTFKSPSWVRVGDGSGNIGGDQAVRVKRRGRWGWGG